MKKSSTEEDADAGDEFCMSFVISKLVKGGEEDKSTLTSFSHYSQIKKTETYGAQEATGAGGQYPGNGRPECAGTQDSVAAPVLEPDREQRRDGYDGGGSTAQGATGSDAQRAASQDQGEQLLAVHVNLKRWLHVMLLYVRLYIMSRISFTHCMEGHGE